MWSKKEETEAAVSGVDPTMVSEPAAVEASEADANHDQDVHVEDIIRDSGNLDQFWATVLPLLGVMPSAIREYPGLFRIVPGPGADEATIHIDMADKPYAPGDKPALQRVVSLTIRLAHDYRLLGSAYYCIDCDLPESDTIH
ncbi:MAG TPA: hypothetical protein VEC57_12735 [Candidatus Limnocylindrales bacterium]|nr:hypothetical protein [Candidatus Limnocylindrales bacterium]